MDPSSIQELSSLLSPPEDKERDTELDVSPSPYATPGTIGPSGNIVDSKNEPAASKQIWITDEVQEDGQNYNYDDPRPQPEYDMIFKQSVGTEDIFLGMGTKNPTTACCENLVVKIKLPGTNIKNVELDVTDKFLDCRTPKWRLGLHLPNKVESKQSKAKWISDKEELHITLLLQREYDFVNQI